MDLRGFRGTHPTKKGAGFINKLTDIVRNVTKRGNLCVCCVCGGVSPKFNFIFKSYLLLWQHRIVWIRCLHLLIYPNLTLPPNIFIYFWHDFVLMFLPIKLVVCCLIFRNRNYMNAPLFYALYFVFTFYNFCCYFEVSSQLHAYINLCLESPGWKGSKWQKIKNFAIHQEKPVKLI
jgi:hypothetical protein